MDCRERAARLACESTRIATLIFVVLAALVALLHAVPASAQTPRPTAREVLDQATAYEYQFRTGDNSAVAQHVALLEAATQAEPDNADLWTALGYAYMLKIANAQMTGGNITEGQPIRKGMTALKRALEIDPNHPEAMSLHGGVQALFGLMLQQAPQMAQLMPRLAEQAPQMLTQGLAEMNRAVELGPDDTRVRLQRAFSGAVLPAALRNPAAEAADLDHLIGVAEWSRAADYLRIMRGDLHFEQGKPELARTLYRSVENTGSAAATDAKARLAALDKGGVPKADIQTLRAKAGAQCTMCHGD